jgi:hypothetical protein
MRAADLQLDAVCVDVEGIDRLGCANVKRVVIRTAEAQIGGDLRQYYAGDRRAVRRVDADPIVVLVGSPAAGGPDIALRVCPAWPGWFVAES